MTKHYITTPAGFVCVQMVGRKLDRETIFRQTDIRQAKDFDSKAAAEAFIARFPTLQEAGVFILAVA